MSKVILRKAEQKDREWLIQVAARNMLELEVKRPELYREEDCSRLMDIGLSTGVIFVCESDGVLCGSIGGIYVPNIFNNQITNLVELFWYVLPEFRGGKAGLLLLNAFCDVGKKTANDIYMSLLSDSEVNTRILKKRGFMFRELAFQMEGIKP